MKKTLGVVLIIAAIILAVFFIRQRKDQDDMYSVGLIQLVSHPALDEIVQGFHDEMKKLGYEEGKNYVIDFQNAQGDQSNLQNIADKFLRDKHQVLVGITTPASQVLASATKEVPIVMGAVSYPVEAGLIQSDEKPGGNVTGVSDRIDVEQLMKVYRQINPDVKVMGILYTSSEDSSHSQALLAQKACEELGLEVKIATISSSNELQQVGESLAGEVDAIYVPNDNTIASAMNTLTQVTDAKKIPVLVSAQTMVEDGGFMALNVDQYQLGVMIAKVTDDLLKGKDPATYPVVVSKDSTVVISKGKADLLGITVPEDILKDALLLD